MDFGHKQMTDQILCTEPETIAKQNFNPLELINNNMFGPLDSAYVHSSTNQLIFSFIFYLFSRDGGIPFPFLCGSCTGTNEFYHIPVLFALGRYFSTQKSHRIAMQNFNGWNFEKCFFSNYKISRGSRRRGQKRQLMLIRAAWQQARSVLWSRLSTPVLFLFLPCTFHTCPGRFSGHVHSIEHPTTLVATFSIVCHYFWWKFPPFLFLCF